MDSSELLAREEEFRKLNKQLEKKTSVLMKQIENAMQKDDIFAEFSQNLNCTKRPVHGQTNAPSPNNAAVNSSNKNSPSHQPNTNTKRVSERNTNSTQNIEQPKSEEVGMKVNGTENKGIRCECCRPERVYVNEDLQFLHAFVSVNVQNKVLPPSFQKERYTVESVCKFLSSKVVLMQEQIEKLQSVINKKTSLCESHLTHYAELESEKLKLMTQANNHRSEALDLKNRCANLQSKLNEKERLYKEQRSEADKLSTEVKKLRAKNATMEARSAGCEDEIGRLRQSIDTLKGSEKELRDASRAHSASQQGAMTRQDLKIRQLTHAVVKLRELVDNLRKQNSILGYDVLLRGLDKEYSALLLGDQ